LTAWDYFFLGAISKLVATTITYPYITLKSRMQASNKESENMMDVARQMMGDGGIAAFYSGIESKLLQSILTAAILFATKEMLYNYTVKLMLFLGGAPMPSKTEL
jgi:adenine nucleotide transporter 17